MSQRFNINECAWVKLTTEGKRMLVSNYAPELMPYLVVSSSGYVRFQLWGADERVR